MEQAEAKEAEREETSGCQGGSWNEREKRNKQERKIKLGRLRYRSGKVEEACVRKPQEKKLRKESRRKRTKRCK